MCGRRSRPLPGSPSAHCDRKRRRPDLWPNGADGRRVLWPKFAAGRPYGEKDVAQLGLYRRVGFSVANVIGPTKSLPLGTTGRQSKRPPKSANASPKRKQFGDRQSKIIMQWVFASQSYEQRQWLASSPRRCC
jgi:hypothetical protein